MATLGALDVVDGGAGTDTLNIVDTSAVASLGGATFSNIETVKIASGGAVGAIAAAAGTNTTAVQQVATVVLTGTYVSTDTVSVTINGVTYTQAVGTVSSADYSGRAEAAAAIKALISAHAGDAVSLGTTVHDTGTSGAASTFLETAFTVTALAVGNPLGITVAKGTVASSTATVGFGSATATQSATVAAKTVTANVAATAPVAVKQVAVVTIADSGTNTATGTITVSIGGSDYSRTGTGGTVTAMAADVASLINSVLGAGTATSSSGVVTVTAPTAGTALPLMNVAFSGYTGSTLTDTWNYTVGNVAANTAATTAAAIAAPTGTTAYTVSATGVANVSGAITTAMDVTGTAVKTSGGSSVKVTASDSVHVSGAKGAVTVTTGAVTSSSTTLIGAVRSDTGGTAGDAKGVYVTGGTDVSVTVSGSNTQAIKIGAAAYSKDAVNATTYPKSNGNVSYDPTGNVTVTGATSTTSTTTGKKDATFNTGTVDIYTNGGSTVTVKGAGTTTVTDQGTFGLRLASTDLTDTIGTSTVTTVNLAGLSGDATIKSDAISTVSVSDTLGARTVTVANSGKTGANSGAINFVVSNLGGASANVTLKDDTATTVNVSSGAATAYDSIGTVAVNAGSKSYIALDTAKATSINFSNDKSVALASSTLTAATTITATGSGSLNLGTVGSATDKLTLVDGSTATGAITATYGATNGTASTAHNLTFKGGAGNDVVTISGTINSAVNTTTAATVQNVIQLGAGNDTVLSNSGVIAAGALVDGGDGIDTIAASLLNSGNASIIRNFEVLGLDLTSGSYDTDLLVGATGLSLLAQGGTYTNVEQTQGLTVTTGASSASTTVTTVSFTASNVTGSADSYTVNFAQSAPASTAALYTTSDAGVIAIEGIETVNVVSGGTGYLNNAITVTDTAARNFTLSGAQNLKVLFSANTGAVVAPASTNSYGVATIDGSAMTGKLTIDTTGVTNAYAGISIKGGSNDDSITLTALDSKAVVDAGAGNDTIVTAAAKATLTLGAGVDTVNAAASVVPTLGSTAATEAEATTSLITITDLAVGDKIDFSSGSTTAQATLGLATSTGSATSLLVALNALANASAAVTWGTYGGNTYIVYDAAATTSGGVLATDVVVKLTGIVDLTNATFDTAGVLTVA